MMYTNYLLPNQYKKIGWLLFIPGIVLGLLLLFEVFTDETITTSVLSLFNEPFIGEASRKTIEIIETGILNEIIAVAIIVGGLLIGLSKEKIEDEFVYKLRTESFVWAMITNYIVLLFATIFIYEMRFFTILIFNMFTPLIFFIIRFNFLKLKSNSDEE